MAGDAAVVVVGTGSFATALCRSLARPGDRPTTVHVVGRTREASDRVCAAAGAGADTEFRSVPTDFTDFHRLFAQLRPELALVCASYQSPAEIARGGTAWTELVRRAGFGVTLPLQAVIAERVAAACADVGDGRTTVINACFPDGVNPVLRARGRHVLCGVGNVHTLAAAAGRKLGVDADHRLAMVAHHSHLHQPDDLDAEARCWLDGVQVEDVTGLLAPARTLPRPRLNELGATAAGSVVRALLDHGRYVGNLPGPGGLPGGFPVELSRTCARLRLPAGVTEDAALVWSERSASADGCHVDRAGGLHFTDRAITELRRHWPELPADLPAATLDHLVERQLALRDRLRRRRA
jgi:hypothetical protein